MNATDLAKLRLPETTVEKYGKKNNKSQNKPKKHTT